MGERSIIVMISGQVQGVGYRWWTVNKAKTLGLDGWVRNRKDGSVEALFSGDVNAIDCMVEECWIGPKFAVVQKLDICEADKPEITEFLQLSTI